MHRLRQIAAWGSTAAAALALAVYASRSETGTQRIAAMVQGGDGRATLVAAPPFNAPVETRRLAEAMDALAAENDQIRTRLAAVEHDMDDVTGSISRQMEAARTSSEPGPTAAATAAATVSLGPILAPVPATPAASRLLAAALAATQQPLTDAPAPPRATAYGIDIGSGLTIQALRERWTTIRAAHPGLFAGLEPIVSVKEIPRANRIELRLVVGPLVQADMAARLCVSLTTLGLFCQPTIFEGQRLAAR